MVLVIKAVSTITRSRRGNNSGNIEWDYVFQLVKVRIIWRIIRPCKHYSIILPPILNISYSFLLETKEEKLVIFFIRSKISHLIIMYFAYNQIIW